MAYSKSLAIETSTFSLLLRGDEGVKKAVSNAELVAMPIVVSAELQAGFLHGKKIEKYGSILEEFLSDASTVLLQITNDTVPIYAELYAYSRSRGKQLSNNDLWIAALCIQYNYPLLTRDNDSMSCHKCAAYRSEYLPQYITWLLAHFSFSIFMLQNYH